MLHSTLYNYAKDTKDKLYCFHFDETRLAKSRNSMMAMPLLRQIQGLLPHILDLFGMCRAVKVKEQMFEFLKKHQLEIINLVSISMDGKNVNLKFHSVAEDALAADGNRGLLLVESCPIHIANNGFNKLISTLSVFIDLDQFTSDLYRFLSKSAARRIEYWPPQKL